jgi:hypothetical protein
VSGIWSVKSNTAKGRVLFGVINKSKGPEPLIRLYLNLDPETVQLEKAKPLIKCSYEQG